MFPEGSPERQTLINRVKAGCAAQSRQIDKTKIGQNVKEMATVCRQYQHISEDDTDEIKEYKEFINSILADKKPYFFRYKYGQTDKEYKDYIKQQEEDCSLRFAMPLEDLFKIPENELTEEQRVFIEIYNKKMPVVMSNCVMNRICWYIESVDFTIRQKVRSFEQFDYRILQSENFLPNKKVYEQIFEVVANTIQEWNLRKGEKIKKGALQDKAKRKLQDFDKDAEYAALKAKLEDVCPNEESLANHLVQLFYEDKNGWNKNILWKMVGRQIYENIRNKTTYCYFPKKNEHGSLEFLYENYSIEKIDLDKVKEDEDVMDALEQEMETLYND